MIEYVRGAEKSIADLCSRLDSIAVYNEVLIELARGVFSFACFVAVVDSLDARTDWIVEQQVDETLRSRPVF